MKKWIDKIILSMIGNPQKLYSNFELLFKKQAIKRQKRFKNFDNVRDIIKDEYKNYLSNREFPYYGKLYFDDIKICDLFENAVKKYHETEDNIKFPEGSSLRLVQIYFGHAPCFIEQYKKDGNIKNVIEEGGVLSFSQSPTGHISIFVFPRKSDYIKREEKFIIYKSNKDPCDIDVAQIRSAIRFFLYYVTTSSSHGYPSFWIEFWVYIKKNLSNIRFSQISSALKIILEKIPRK